MNISRKMMENTECILCQKPNCDLRCPNCGAFFCSDSHYSSHVYCINKTKRNSPNNIVPGDNKPGINADFESKNGEPRIANGSNDANEISICLPFKILNSKKFGRYFVATRDIRPLELILVDNPGVVGPATKTKPVCIVCLNPAKRGSRYMKLIM